MSEVPSRRTFLSRALERGDPRLGLIVGAVVSLLCALVFARPDLFGPAQRLENIALDLAFRWRPPIEEDDRIVHVDIDDNTVKLLSWPMKRRYFAHALLALDRLGAETIAVDVEFKTREYAPEEIDAESGAYLLEPDDRRLRAAMALSGRVMLAYHFDTKSPVPEDLRRALPRVNEVLARDIMAGVDEVAAAAGVEPGRLEDVMESLRTEGVVKLVAERLSADPELAFRDLREAFVPGFDPKRHGKELRILQNAYWLERGRRLIAERSATLGLEGFAPEGWSALGVVPPLYPFLEKAASLGFVNAEHDADGVMRRPATHMAFRDRAYPYLGLQAAVETLGRPETALQPGVLRVGDRSFPLDDEGRLLVNWAGNGTHHRNGEGRPPFAHLPFSQLTEYYQKRFELIDENTRATVRQVVDDVPELGEYLKVSDRYRRVLAGEAEAGREDLAGLEARMGALRKALLDYLGKVIAFMEKSLERNPSPRVRRMTEEQIGNYRQQRDGLVEAVAVAEAQEAKLRPKVEGKLAFVASVSTAGGDHHATPIAPGTPGVDVLGSVANMLLTGKPIERVPAVVNFVYLLVVGMAVSLAVTRFATATGALVLGLVAGASVGLFGWLFTGSSLLLVGTGSVVTSVLSFAGTTAYKELVTQRSKRKLQGELEKQTSPELVRIIIENPDVLRTSRKMTGSFFFSDIKGFTSLTERLPAEVVIPLVNRYLDRMTRAVMARMAYVDKYIGDAIMALFGIPVPSEDHARNACLAALENQVALRELNDEFERDGLPRVACRIGINSGEANAGYVGAADRRNYTVLGDAVNLASRLEGANKEYGTSIMASEFTRDRVAGEFVFRELDRIRVVGKRNAVRIYELVAAKGAPRPFPDGFLEAYDAAMTAFKERRWQEAVDGFEEALRRRPGDRPSEIHLSRSREFLVTPPPPDWEGVFELLSK